MIAPSPQRLSERSFVDSTRNTLDVLRRHRRKSVLFCLATLAVVVAWLAFAPRKYQSHAQLFVRVGRESVTLDPTATTGQTISVYESREVEINSVLDLLSSRRILERVVDDLGVDTILGRPESATPGDAAGSRLEREQAIRRLEATVDTWHNRKSSVINAGAQASSPELAQRLLESFLEAFHTSYLEANRTSGSHAFFVTQADLLTGELEAAADALSRAKNEIDLVSIDEQRRTVQAQMSDVQAQRLAAETSLATAQATIVQLREMLQELPERLVTQTIAGFPDGADGQTRRQLYELEIREKELLTKFTGHHPLVKAVREQIAAAREILATPDAPVEQTTLAINPARQQLELQLLNEQTQAVALGARVAALDGQQQAVARRLRDLNEREGRIARLEQRVELLQASHHSYAEKREQARIDQALADSRITNVNVVQSPTYVSRPVAPNKKLVAALGLFVALVGGIGLAFGCEYLPQLMSRGNVRRNTNGRVPSLPAESHSHDVHEASPLVEAGVR
ncbi:MAG TPA: GumC family protein [Planctomycetaceae bacterium]|nr:GumC family protein [Planctomycetaceae bacterium]